MVCDHMRFFGDKGLIRRHLGCIDRILDCFDRHVDESGLTAGLGGMNTMDRYWSFIDWTPEWNETSGVPDAYRSGPLTAENLLYIMGLQASARLCDYIGRHDTAEEYLTRAKAVQAAVLASCRGENGMLTDGPSVEKYSQHVQVFAVLTDTVSAEEGREALLRTLEEPSKYAQSSVSFMYYLFRALEKTDLYEWSDQYWDIWRGMLRDHLTT